MENRVLVTAVIAEIKILRYTPAGLPAVDVVLEHRSTQTEADQPRQVNAVLKAIAFGALAERIARQAVGSTWTFQGFLATPRNSKSLVLHIQDIQQDTY
ncbi:MULTISPECIES: primosomal replication protein N [Comamonas]|uniref:Replication restart protein PriB n=1 Tax=Comamonas squillarum TaxID=2977320 RepID=A0ABY5ZWC8_9BURK|nr:MULTISPECIES: primosomal replication protein N [Comamonas]MCS4295322.1 primosomal replication protein N [Comamonas sp. BIGb0152]PWB20384.1 primosomal replication protein N [Comamonas sp. JNW]UXC18297.1 primosomal replication protein N [Comamonas sp. PR12]